MSFFQKYKRHRIVSCEDARKRVLLTGGLDMVCPDDADIQETLEDDTEQKDLKQQPTQKKDEQ